MIPTGCLCALADGSVQPLPLHGCAGTAGRAGHSDSGSKTRSRGFIQGHSRCVQRLHACMLFSPTFFTTRAMKHTLFECITQCLPCIPCITCAPPICRDTDCHTGSMSSTAPASATASTTSSRTPLSVTGARTEWRRTRTSHPWVRRARAGSRVAPDTTNGAGAPHCMVYGFMVQENADCSRPRRGAGRAAFKANLIQVDFCST